VNGSWHPIADLSDLRVGRGPCGAFPAHLSLVAVAVTFIDCVSVVSVGSYLIAGPAAIVVAVLAGMAMAGWRRRDHMLWVRCRGERIMLYAHRDPIQFGKFSRALVRAIHGEPPPQHERVLAP
jgi:hypothetical protein